MGRMLKVLDNSLTFLVFSVPFFLVIRFFPMWGSRDWGCDTYYFLLCRSIFRNKKSIPIKVGGIFILDHHEEWYPPLFTLFISFLPDFVIKKYYWAISNIVDLFLINFFCVWVGSYIGWGEAVIILTFYAASPGLVSEFSSLTSRAVAALFFTCLIFSVVVSVQYNSLPALAISCLLMWVLIFTHKLTVQLLWFVLPFCAVVFLDYWFLIPLVGGYLLSFIFTPKMTVKIIRAHYDILIFWSVFWPDLGKHQLYQSPLYGNPSDELGGWFNIQNYWLDIKKQIKLLLGGSPFGPALLPSLFVFGELDWATQFAMVVALAIYFWSAATSFLTFLRAFGEGVKYLKFAEVFTLYVVVNAIFSGSILTVILSTFAVVMTLRGYVRAFHNFKDRELQLTRQDGVQLTPLYEFIKHQPSIRLLVLPLHLADRTAYETRKPVLWGAHGYGFKNLHGFFPVLTKPIEYFINRYALTHALIDTVEISLDTVGFHDKKVLMQSGRYVLCKL